MWIRGGHVKWLVLAFSHISPTLNCSIRHWGKHFALEVPGLEILFLFLNTWRKPVSVFWLHSVGVVPHWPSKTYLRSHRLLLSFQRIKLGLLEGSHGGEMNFLIVIYDFHIILVFLQVSISCCRHQRKVWRAELRLNLVRKLGFKGRCFVVHWREGRIIEMTRPFFWKEVTAATFIDANFVRRCSAPSMGVHLRLFLRPQREGVVRLRVALRQLLFGRRVVRVAWVESLHIVLL